MPKLILAAEDNIALGTAYKSTLEKAGYAVVWVKTGAELLHEAKHGAFDLILSDIMMAGGSGDLAIGMMREEGLATPILVVTAKERVDLPPGVTVLHKPITLDALVAEVGKRLGETPAGAGS